MATAGEKVQETASAAAEKMAEAAAEAAAAAGQAMGGDEWDESLGGVEGEIREESNDWSFLAKAAVAVVVVIVCLVAAKVLRGESPEEKRLRLRAERRAKKKATQQGPDEIDKLLSSIVRRQPGQAPPPGAVPISGRGAPRGMPSGGRGAGAAAAARAMAAVGNRSNGAGRGPTPPGGVDNRPKLRWDQTNDEVEIVIRVDPRVVRSDVKVDVTSHMLKLSLRNQTIISGPLFEQVDAEGCTWHIDNPAPGQPKEITITLLKARPATSREQWWRAPLKGLENRGPAQRPSQPADPELVRKAIEAIKAKSAAGAAGAKPGAKLGAKPVTTAALTSPSNGSAGSKGVASGNAAPGAGAPGGGGGSAGASAPGSNGAAAATKAARSGGKKKNRKKK